MTDAAIAQPPGPGLPAPHRTNLDEQTVLGVLSADSPEEEAAMLAGQHFDRNDDASAIARGTITATHLRLDECRKRKAVCDRLWARSGEGRVAITDKIDFRQPRLHRLSAYGLLAVSGFALFMGNRVGANYVVASGNDLYAADPLGAAMFVAVIPMGGGALKAFERLIPTEAGRQLYSRLLFGFGLFGVVLWIIMMATTFAPSTAGASSWLTEGDSSTAHLSAILLVAGHLVSDLACGYVAFAGAESLLLAGNRRCFIPDPGRERLAAESDGLLDEMEQLIGRRAEAERMLEQAAAAKAEVEQQARRAVQLVAERQKHAVEAATSAARATFLN